MKDEGDPITPDEWLIRRIPLKRFRKDEVPIVSPGAFEPRLKGRDVDETGISLYRQACLAHPSEALATVPEERRHEDALVRVQVAFLLAQGLSVRPERDERVKGHVVIPELNALDYRAKKATLSVKQLALAEEASKDENILQRPGLPEETTSEPA
ncbi:MAG: hypothetical protein K2W96_17250 [Gemmataceae bacterium]|nr:hypothetical protein [Gemmataceae bacterium]